MTFLPIVERELRLASRRREVYLTRTGAGMAAMLIGVIAALTAAFNPGARFANIYLQSLGGIALAYCLLAGRFLTADCLSREKREETLGLLFLTPLKGHDVVLGKLAATSVNGLFGLMAVVPMLAMTLLTGGTTLGEIARVALSLFAAFIFSLAAGILASALAREFQSAVSWNFSLLLALGGIPPALSGILVLCHAAGAVVKCLLLPWPVYTFLMAFDINYTTQRSQFWASLGFVFATALLLVGLASRYAPIRWQTNPGAKSKKARISNATAEAENNEFRAQMLDENAYCWLAARPRKKARTIWIITGSEFLWLLGIALVAHGAEELAWVSVVIMLHTTLKLWITLEAAHTLAEDVRDGGFELLLTTPLSPAEIVEGQIKALRHLFQAPLVVAGTVETIFMGALLTGASGETAYIFCAWLAGLAMLAADAVTLRMVAMHAALTEKNVTQATIKTARLILILPWALWGLVIGLESMWRAIYRNGASFGWPINLAAWAAIGFAVDWYFWRRASRQLRENFRELAMQRFEAPTAGITLGERIAAGGRYFRERICPHPRFRKWAVALGTLSLAWLGLTIWQARHPPELPAEIAWTGPNNRTALQAFPAEHSVFLLLPDGSLWQWGQIDGNHSVRQPARIGPFRDWKFIYVHGPRHLGIRQDGSLWEWQQEGTANQISEDHDWVQAVGMGGYTVALKADGSLWEWGDIGDFRPGLSIPVQPVTSSPNWPVAPPPSGHHWIARTQGPVPVIGLRRWGWGRRPRGTSAPPPFIRSALARGPFIAGSLADQPDFTFAIDTNHTLWLQGPVLLIRRTPSASTIAWSTNYEDPIQISRETNWIGFDAAGYPQTSLGETWDPLMEPNSTASIESIGNPIHAKTPVRLGTNRNWIALDIMGNVIFGIQSNGTLYAWGDISTVVPGVPAQTLLPVTQFCRESDWVGFDRSLGPVLARNQSGELWMPFAYSSITSHASSTTPMSAMGSLYLVVDTNLPARLTPANSAGLTRYLIESNGTLWTRPFQFKGGSLAGVKRPEEPVDNRTNWVALAGAASSTFGLTADGTLWMWGLDYGRPKNIGPGRMEATAAQVLSVFGSPKSPGPQDVVIHTYENQVEPRPLIITVSATSSRHGGP